MCTKISTFVIKIRIVKESKTDQILNFYLVLSDQIRI